MQDNADFVQAVKATGRKTLIIAGTITSVCMAFPAISAVAEGYKVFAVIDASGTYSKMAQEITMARVVQAGVVPMDTAAVASELQHYGIGKMPQNGRMYIPKYSRPISY